jgi:hypothetical protein
MRKTGWIAGRSVLLLIASLHGALTTGAEIDNRTPVPDAASVEAAEELVRDVFGEEHRAAKSTADKVALAKKMLAAATRSIDAPVEQFVLFRVTRDIAASAADVETAFEAVEGMSQRFRVDKVEMQVAVLEKISDGARLPSDHRALLQHLDAVFDEAIASERFDVARQVHKLATASAVKSRDVAARKNAAAWLKELDRREKDFAAVKQALAVLDERPTDPEANLVVGKYRCFIKGDWEAGLPMLALGSDAGLKRLATLELAGSHEASECVAIGDAWWELADKADADTAMRIRSRAATWYDTAVPQLSGLVKAKAEQRLRKVGEDKNAMARNPELRGSQRASRPDTTRGAPKTTKEIKRGKPTEILSTVDTSRHAVRSVWSRNENGITATRSHAALLMIPVEIRGSYQLDVTFTRNAGSDIVGLVLPVGDHGCMVLFSAAGGAAGGIALIDGKSIGENGTARKPCRLANGKQYRIACQVQLRGTLAAIRVFLDGQAYFEWTGDHRRLSIDRLKSVPRHRHVGLYTHDSQTTFHSVQLKIADGIAVRDSDSTR